MAEQPLHHSTENTPLSEQQVSYFRRTTGVQRGWPNSSSAARCEVVGICEGTNERIFGNYGGRNEREAGNLRAERTDGLNGPQAKQLSSEVAPSVCQGRQRRKGDERTLGAEGVLPGRYIESLLRVFKQFTHTLPSG